MMMMMMMMMITTALALIMKMYEEEEEDFKPCYVLHDTHTQLQFNGTIFSSVSPG